MIINGLTEFIIDYTFEGNQWSFPVFAESRLDAEARLKKIKSAAVIFGSVKAAV